MSAGIQDIQSKSSVRSDECCRSNRYYKWNKVEGSRSSERESGGAVPFAGIGSGYPTFAHLTIHWDFLLPVPFTFLVAFRPKCIRQSQSTLFLASQSSTLKAASTEYWFQVAAIVWPYTL